MFCRPDRLEIHKSFGATTCPSSRPFAIARPNIPEPPTIPTLRISFVVPSPDPA